VRRWKAAAAAVVLVACGSETQPLGPRLSGPAALAIFHGRTAERPDELGSYLAVASSRADELRIVDLVDNEALLAPVQFAPLSVPAGDRPARLASASLNDGGADALVVVPAGSSELQLVQTWAAPTRVVPGSALDLATLAPGAEILAIVGAPLPEESDPPGSWVPAVGAARFLVALSGGRLAVVRASRGPGPDGEVVLDVAPEEIVDLASRLVPPAADPFDAVSLAVSPVVGLAYAASPDAIGGVLGAAELNLAGAPAGWTVRALDARAPTFLVAAFETADRDLDPAARDYPDSFHTTKSLRVYVALDETGCGRDRQIPCGLAVIDPALGGLVPDPAGELPYLVPIGLPARPIAIAVSGPPANGTAAWTSSARKAIYLDAGGAPLEVLRMAPSTGATYTAAMAVVATADGRASWVDLSRWRTPSDVSALRSLATGALPGVAATGVVGLPGFVDGVPGAFLGICEYDAGSCVYSDDKIPDVGEEEDPTQPVLTSAVAASRIRVTPGYTPDRGWAVRYQTPLPGLSGRRGVLGRANGTLYAAFQVPSGVGDPPFFRVIRVYAPSFGVNSVATDGAPDADALEVELDEGTPCALGDGTPIDAFSAPVQDLLPPDGALYPGGALEVGAITSPAGATCDGIAEGQAFPATLTVRASGLVLVGDVAFRSLTLDSGTYAGRPRFEVPFELIQYPEEILDCPLIPWPETGPVPYCGIGCRAFCEALVLSRLARRNHYIDTICPAPVCTGPDQQTACFPVREDPPGSGTFVSTDPCLRHDFDDPRYVYPLPTGSPVGILVGTIPSEWTERLEDGTTVTHVETQPKPGSRLEFATTSGMLTTSRRPILNNSVVGAAMPTDAVVFDRSTLLDHEDDGLRFYVSYPDNQVLVFSPAAAASDIKLIR
jgi:hypothetical protein